MGAAVPIILFIQSTLGEIFHTISRLRNSMMIFAKKSIIRQAEISRGQNFISNYLYEMW